MNSTIVGICLNGITMSTEEYTIGHFSSNGNQYGIQDGIWGRNTYYEYDLAGRINGVGVYAQDGTMRAYQSVRYNDGKGTVESMTSTMFSAAGGKLRSVDYAFTYGDPAKGEIADTLYKYDFGGGEYTFAYDGLARLQNRTLVYGTNTKTESYTYKDSNLEGFTTTLVDTMTDFAGKAHSYTYDANGNILSETFDNYTVTYEYDHLNRMTRYNNPSLGSTYVYAYDDRGNITSVNMYEYSAGDLGEATYVIDYGYTDPSWPDLMTSYYGTDIVYDDLGNPQNWVWGETLTWENGRQLAKYESDGKTVNYTYNADGLRTSKSGDRTTEYFIVDGQYIGEVTKVGYMTYNVAYLYDENGSPAGLNVNGQEFFFVKNIQGDVLGIVNPNGYLVVTYRYDAYGNTISMKDSSGNEITNPQAIANVNPFRYRGYMYDIESGFYYLRSRYYDPSVGRFLSADGLVTTGQGFDGNNMFAYCGNNPVMRVDTSGRFFALIVGLAVTTICTIKTAKKVNNNLREKNYKHNAKRDNNKDTTTQKKVLNNQYDDKVSGYEYGVRSADRNGCEAIAIHNAKLLNGVDSTLTNTIEDIQNSNGMILQGVWGTNPYVIDDVLVDSGLNVESVDLADMTVPGTYIVSYFNNGNVFEGIHTVCVGYNGQRYAIYNVTTEEGTGTYFWDSLSYFENGFICGYYVGG